MAIISSILSLHSVAIYGKQIMIIVKSTVDGTLLDDDDGGTTHDKY